MEQAPARYILWGQALLIIIKLDIIFDLLLIKKNLNTNPIFYLLCYVITQLLLIIV